MSNEDLLRQYLPASYRDSPIVKLLCAAWGVELDAWDATAETTVQQFCVATAPEEGILKWEQELALTPPAGATLELRRALVQAKLMRPPIMTPEQIQAICNCFVPGKGAKVIDPVAAYTFKILVPSLAPWLDEMVAAVDEAKPAHLDYTVEVSIQPPSDDPDVDTTNRLDITVGIASLCAGVETSLPPLPEDSGGAIYYGIASGMGGIMTTCEGNHTETKASVVVGAFCYECGEWTTIMEGVKA